jgi:peroxiredoxin
MNMHRVWIGFLAFACFALLASEGRLLLGAKAPRLNNSLSAKGRAALVFVPVLADTAACRSEMKGVDKLQAQVKSLGVSVVSIVPYTEESWRKLCPGISADVRFVFDADRTIASSYGAKSGVERLGVFIDEQGAVRRIVRTGQQFVATFASDVKAWEEGKGSYDAQCARCHGADGTSTGYPEIKTLNGIGNRMDEAEIIRRTSLTANVDLSSLTDARFRALAIYVAGL